MIIEIPVVIQPRTDPVDGTTLYAVRPLFFESPEHTDRDVGKAIAKFGGILAKELRRLGRSGRHEELSAYTFSPDVRLHWLDLRLELRGGMFRGQFPVATFEHLGRTVAFSPRLFAVWFEVGAGANLKTQATEVYTRHLRELEKHQEKAEVEGWLEPFREKKRPWLSQVELDVEPRAEVAEPKEERFSLFGGAESLDGAEELAQVGQCLDELFPDQLERAFQRDRLVETLDDLLWTPDNRPILLVGTSLVGKTTLIHEVVYRREERRRREATMAGHAERAVWRLASQRLVSGMSYVGQWENRLLAILRHVRHRKLVLYVDDLLGLFQAGVTSQSNISAADVLKPYVERREVRVLAEMTPEQLRIFRERDRGFADQFHLLTVEEPAEELTLRILLGVVRRLEARYHTRFALEVLPTVLDLTRRYHREAAFPGKATRWLGQLAMKYPGQEVSREATLEEFRLKSGLEMAFVDRGAKLPRETVLDALRTQIVGQREAVEAMADVVSIAKARLNDPERPLGSLFFLGPTGVGKTECAKALARYLFGDVARLVRFDMNEFVSPQSAARLAGTFDQPEGLLTSAIRRQPFCVLLFDEIEKAHPDVFDLLLQILGEARLTDALGRTADFSNAVIILTSNLGTQQAAREIGFDAGETAAEGVYRKAVEAFFRPEFFNRLDRILPFQRLSRAELGQIAHVILQDVMAREGLTRRKCVVDLTGEALDWIIDRGYHPAMGARAMRRAVEQELVRPLARRLSAIQAETPSVLRVSRRGDGLEVIVTPLVEVERLPESARPERLDTPSQVFERAKRALDRMKQACDTWCPQGETAARWSSPEHAWYLAVMEGLNDTRVLMREIAESLRTSRPQSYQTAVHPKQGRSRLTILRDGQAKYHRVLKELCAAQDILAFVQEVAADSGRPSRADPVDKRLRELLDRLILLEALGPWHEGWRFERVLVLVRSLGNDAELREAFTHALRSRFSVGWFPWHDADGRDAFGPETEHWSPASCGQKPGWLDWVGDPVLQAEYRARHHLDVLVCEGPQMFHWLRADEGTHLVITETGRLTPLQVILRPLKPEEQAGRILIDCLAQHDRYQDAVAHGQSPPGTDPFAWQPAVALYSGTDVIADFRSGLRVSRRSRRSQDAVRLARLPLPPEFQE